MDDIFEYVKEEKEEVLCKYGNVEARLKEKGRGQYLLPGTLSGLFLCIAAALFEGFEISRLTLLVTRGVGAAGGVIIASSLLFYAMFVRQARRAGGNFLYITNKNVVWCDKGRYAKMPLSDISDVRVDKVERLSSIPFDMSELEGECLVLFYRGSDMRIPYIDNPADAKDKIKALIG